MIRYFYELGLRFVLVSVCFLAIFTPGMAWSSSYESSSDAPQEQIDCVVSVTNLTTENQFVLVSSLVQLLPEVKSVDRICKLKRASLKKQYRSYFSDLFLDCADPLPIGVLNKIESQSEIERGQITFTLARFPSSNTKIAGLSLTFNAERGYFGSVLLEPLTDGPYRQIQTPLKFPDQLIPGLLLISCTISSPKSAKPF